MNLQIVVKDAFTHELLPCRLSFRGAGAPPLWGSDNAGQPLAYAGLPRLWCDGRWAGELPDLPLTLTVSRLYEYASRTLSLAPGVEPCLTVELQRRCNLPACGWHAGDAHQHVVHGEALLQVNLPLAARVARAEGMDWMVFDGRFTSVPGEEEPGPAQLDALCAAASGPDFLALWADEYPKHDLGHLACLPLGRAVHPVEIGGPGIYHLGPDDRTPYTTFESVRALQRCGSTAVYVHPLRELGGTPGRVGNIARELPLDLLAAPWAVEAIDLLSDEVDDPQCWQLWYRLLDQGYRIGLCAFNDACFDRAGGEWREPVAYRRTYVQVDGPLTREALVAGIRQGRTWGTTGPLVLFEIDGCGPGSVLPADGRARGLRIRAWGAPGYRDPACFGGIVKVEVIRGGSRAACWEFDEPRESVELEFEVAERDPAWYLVRVSGRVEEQLAVTSPVYFEGPGYAAPQPQPIGVRARIVDVADGRPLGGVMELVAYAHDRVELVERRAFAEGCFAADVPGDLRLRATAAGYQPQTLSPILDCPLIYRELLGGIRRSDLADAAYYERLRQALAGVELNFRLQRVTIQ